MSFLFIVMWMKNYIAFWKSEYSSWGFWGEKRELATSSKGRRNQSFPKVVMFPEDGRKNSNLSMFPIAEKQVTNISHLGVGTIPIFF